MVTACLKELGQGSARKSVLLVSGHAIFDHAEEMEHAFFRALHGCDHLVVNIARIWESAAAKQQAAMEVKRREAEERDRKVINAKLAELEEDLKEVVSAYVGKVGRTLVEKELGDQGGRQCLLDKDGLARFMAGIERGAKLLTSMTKLQEMLRTIEAEVAGRTSIQG